MRMLQRGDHQAYPTLNRVPIRYLDRARAVQDLLAQELLSLSWGKERTQKGVQHLIRTQGGAALLNTAAHRRGAFAAAPPQSALEIVPRPSFSRPCGAEATTRAELQSDRPETDCGS